jgi:hypothetical protein
MAKVLSAGELTTLRTRDQYSQLYMGIYNPPTRAVLMANIDGSIGSTWSNIGVANVPFTYIDGLSGSWIPDMTMYIGPSGSAGGDYSMGMVRVRGQPINTGTVLPIGETSEVVWGDGQTLTIVDEFVLWQRHWRIQSINDPGDTLYMDYDIAYTGQNDVPEPVPIIGPHASVIWLPIIGGPANIQFDASNSYTGGQGIIIGATYAWTAVGSIAIDNAASQTPIITYDTPGVYRVSCTITSVFGASFQSHRYVFVYDDASPAYKDFVLNECSGDWDEGGWSFKITAYDNAMRSDIRDKALVVLFAKDVYGDTETSIGPLALDGRENVIAMGWIDGESIVWNPVKGNVEFEVQGPHWWLKQMGALPDEISDTDFSGAYAEDGVTPVVYNWNLISDLNIDKGTYRFLRWRTTAHRLMDVPLANNNTLIAYFDTTKGNLWEQLVSMTKDTILAHPCVDRYGILRIQLEPQLVSAASRNFTTVMDITKQDWMSQIGIERATVNKVGSVYISGTIYVGGIVDPSCAEGGGDSGGPGHHGGFERIDRLALDNAAQAAELAVLVKAWRNNPYPSISIPLSSNNRTMDICPQQWITLTINEDETERGIVFTQKKMIPRHVSINYDSAIGRILVDVVVEADTSADIIAGRAGGAAAGVPCPEAPERDPIDPFPTMPFPEIPPFPDIPVPTIPELGQYGLTRNSFRNANEFQGIDDPDTGKSINHIPINPFAAVELLDSNMNGNVVSSNRYVYWIKTSAFRKSIKTGFFDLTIASGGDGGQINQSIALLTEDVVVLMSDDANTFYIKTLDFTDGTYTTLMTISDGDGSTFVLDNARLSDGLYVVRGNDENLYVVFPLAYENIDLSPSRFTDIYYYIYNWTTSTEYSPIILPVDDTVPDDVDVLFQFHAPAVVGPEMVFTFHVEYDSAPFPTVIPIHNVNPETQTGRNVDYGVVDGNASFDAINLVPDRFRRDVYFINFWEWNGDFNYPIIKYDLALNSVSTESDHVKSPRLVNDKEFVYKVIWNGNGVGYGNAERMVSGIPYSLPQIVFNDSPGRHAMDDINRNIYAIKEGIIHMSVPGGGERRPVGLTNTIISDESGDNTDLVIQGDHAIISQNKTMYVLYWPPNV